MEYNNKVISGYKGSQLFIALRTCEYAFVRKILSADENKREIYVNVNNGTRLDIKGWDIVSIDVWLDKYYYFKDETKNEFYTEEDIKSIDNYLEKYFSVFWSYVNANNYMLLLEIENLPKSMKFEIFTILNYIVKYAIRGISIVSCYDFFSDVLSAEKKNLPNELNKLPSEGVFVIRNAEIKHYKIPVDCLQNIYKKYVDWNDEQIVNKITKIEENYQVNKILIENNINKIISVIIDSLFDKANQVLKEIKKILLSDRVIYMVIRNKLSSVILGRLLVEEKIQIDLDNDSEILVVLKSCLNVAAECGFNTVAMKHALQLFDDGCNLKTLTELHIVLDFNKYDYYIGDPPGDILEKKRHVILE